MTDYTPPDHHIGQSVWYYPTRDETDAPMLAFIGSQEGRLIDLHVLEPGFQSAAWKTGIRHIGDPVAKGDTEKYPATRGCWAHTSDTIRLRRLESLVGELMEDKPADDPSCGLSADALKAAAFSMRVRFSPTASRSEIAQRLTAAGALVSKDGVKVPASSPV